MPTIRRPDFTAKGYMQALQATFPGVEVGRGTAAVGYELYVEFEAVKNWNSGGTSQHTANARPSTSDMHDNGAVKKYGAFKTKVEQAFNNASKNKPLGSLKNYGTDRADHYGL